MTTIMRVKYPYQWIQDNNQSITLDCIPPEIAQQRQLLGNFWMYQEDDEVVTKLSSALATGLRLEYPDEEMQLYWQFWERFACMDICTYVLQSFNENEDCQEGLVGLLNALGFGGGGGAGGQDVPVEEIDDEALKDFGAGCTGAEMYGLAYALIAQVDTIATDFFEVVEAFTNPAEYATVLADNAGLLSFFPATISETVTWLQDTVAETYAGAFNPTTHEALACELYCLTKDNCRITISDMRDAYRVYIGSFLPAKDAGWIDFIESLVDIILSADILYVAVVHLFILEILVRGSQFFGSTNRTLEIASAMASTLSPPAGCDCDDIWCIEYDFTIDDYGFAMLQNDANRGGTWTNGVGWQVYSNPGFSINLAHNIEPPYTILETEIDVNVTQLPSSGNIGIVNLTGSGGIGTTVVAGQQTVTLTHTITWSSGGGWKIQGISQFTGEMQYTIQRIRITGMGTKEVGVPDC